MMFPGEREPASFIRRAGAYLIDLAALGLIWFGSAVVVGIPGNRPEEGFHEPWDTFVEIIIYSLPAYWFVYHWVSNAVGQSIGKRMLSISIQPAITERSRVVRGLIRAIGEVISAVPFGLGYWWALWDSENRTWHDKLSRTRVVGRRVRAARHAPATAEQSSEPGPKVEGKNLRFVCRPSSPAAGVRYVELRREGVRFEDEHGLRGFRFEDVEEAKVLPTGEVELRLKGRDTFDRPNEQIVRLVVDEREAFLAELEARVEATTGRPFAVSQV